MKLQRIAAAVAATLVLVGCQSGGEESPAPSEDVEEVPSDLPTPTPMPNQPSEVESMNEDEEWDDWGIDDPLPEPGDGNNLVHFIRIDFTDPEAIDAHVRVGVPAGLFEGTDSGGEGFCSEPQPDPLVVGFGAGWSAERSERDGYILCDTTGTFGLDEWGDDALVPAPELVDGTWEVDFQEAFWPDPGVELYRFRMEFGGEVGDASEGGRIDGDAVTWHGPAALSATAEAGQ